MSNSLNSCPLCNGDITHYCTDYKSYSYRDFYYRCNKCKTTFVAPVNSKYISEKETQQEAIMVWNNNNNDKNDIGNLKLLNPEQINSSQYNYFQKMRSYVDMLYESIITG